MSTTFALDSPRRLAPAIISIIGLRTALNAAYRAPLPFLTYIAAAFGAQPESVGWLGAAFALSGLSGPFVGLLEEKLGRRGAIAAPVALFVAACFAVPLAPSLGLAAVCFVLLGVSKALYEPLSTAFLSEHVVYERRGTVIGLVELAWALAWILGVPLFGWLIEAGRWWLPFVIAGAVGGGFGLAVLRFASHQVVQPTQSHAKVEPGYLTVIRTPGAANMLAFMVLIIGAAQLATLTYAPWFQQQFALTPARLGVVSIVIGVADLLAELATIVFVDRLGKRRSLMLGSVLYAASLILFWLFSRDFALATAALFCIFFFFEFTLVTGLTVQSETVPAARATMQGFGQASNALARIITSLIALPLFIAGSLAFPMLLGAVMIGLAIIVASRLWSAGILRAFSAGRTL